jgi:hypothetical protein
MLQRTSILQQEMSLRLTERLLLRMVSFAAAAKVSLGSSALESVDGAVTRDLLYVNVRILFFG